MSPSTRSKSFWKRCAKLAHSRDQVTGLVGQIIPTVVAWNLCVFSPWDTSPWHFPFGREEELIPRKSANAWLRAIPKRGSWSVWNTTAYDVLAQGTGLFFCPLPLESSLQQEVVESPLVGNSPRMFVMFRYVSVSWRFIPFLSSSFSGKWIPKILKVQDYQFFCIRRSLPTEPFVSAAFIGSRLHLLRRLLKHVGASSGETMLGSPLNPPGSIGRLLLLMLRWLHPLMNRGRVSNSSTNGNCSMRVTPLPKKCSRNVLEDYRATLASTLWIFTGPGTCNFYWYLSISTFIYWTWAVPPHICSQSQRSHAFQAVHMA